MKNKLVVVSVIAAATLLGTSSVSFAKTFKDVVKSTGVSQVKPDTQLNDPWADNAILSDKNGSVVAPFAGTQLYGGYGGTTGDTFTTNVAVGGTVNYAFDPLTFNTFKGSFNYNGSRKSGATAHNYNFTDYVVHNFNTSNGVYAMVSYDKNFFNNLDYVVTESVGYRRLLVKTDNQSLNMLIGPAAVQKIGPKNVSTIKRYDGYLAANLMLNYSYALNDNVSLGQSIGVVAGGDETDTQALTSLTSKLTSRLSSQVSFGWTNTTNPVANANRNNTTTTVALIYGI